MKVVTFNVNSIRARLHIVIPWLREHRPDIFCMQETKVDDRNFPENEFSRAGYQVYFSGAKGKNGVAIATLHEPNEVIIGMDGSEKDRVITLRFDRLSVTNVYIPQGQSVKSEKYRYKLDFLRRFKDYLKEIVDFNGYHAVCGDMNVAPEEIDVHNPQKLKNHVCFHVDARNAYREVLSLGFVDLLRKFHPEERIYTFYDYRVRNAIEKGLGWRVDAILATPKLAEKCRDCYADMKPRLMERPSDHLPLIAEFEL